MAQINRVAPRDSGISQLLTIGGAVGGAFAGNPMAGAGAGQMAAGFIDQPKAPTPMVGEGGSEAAAMARKQQEMSTDNLATLKQAEATLPTLPENLRQQYAPAIVQARLLEQQKRGIS